MMTRRTTTTHGVWSRPLTLAVSAVGGHGVAGVTLALVAAERVDALMRAVALVAETFVFICRFRAYLRFWHEVPPSLGHKHKRQRLNV